MKLLIVGSGRMGIRHLLGALDAKMVDSITIFDINQNALNNAKDQVNEKERNKIIQYVHGANINECINLCDIAIISSTANNREEILKTVIKLGAKNVLIEKPLGQSFEEVQKLLSFCNEFPTVKFDVNLNMRLYPGFIKLKQDLNCLEQAIGIKTISVNTGSLGIGANGIHYIDLLFFLFEANQYELSYAEIDDFILPSGRGEEFADFGGISVMKFFSGKKYLGKAMVSITSESTVFGGWDIVAPHARIIIDELKSLRINHFRDPSSKLPFNRYAAEYLAPEEVFFDAPSLSSITTMWLDGAFNKKRTLPSIEEALQAHKLMFDWLEKSTKYNKKFPIT